MDLVHAADDFDHDSIIFLAGKAFSLPKLRSQAIWEGDTGVGLLAHSLDVVWRLSSRETPSKYVGKNR
jgi:hypothetical protein